MKQRQIGALLQQIGESVEIYYEPRNKGAEWYVGLADSHRISQEEWNSRFDAGEDPFTIDKPPLHEHFPSLTQGLEWLIKAKEEKEVGR